LFREGDGPQAIPDPGGGPEGTCPHPRIVTPGIRQCAGPAVHPGRIVTSFVAGTRRVFDFVPDNPVVAFDGCNRTKDAALIRKTPRVCGINGALKVDLSGQVCAASLGHRIVSGIGGQMDSIRGAALWPGGKSIIASHHRPPTAP
jgi:acyl-CoA hydrolase